MKTKKIKKMVEVAEKLGWSAERCQNEIILSKFSPAGQDFNITVTASRFEEAFHTIDERCEDFDCSEETYLWLDDTGHGKSGAPYDMKDLYEDMESSLKMLEELRDELKSVE